MKKALDFSTYKKFQKLSFNDTNRLFHALYANAYDDCRKEMLNNCSASLTEDHLMEIILSVKGVGKNRAKQIVDKILEEGISYNGFET